MSGYVPKVIPEWTDWPIGPDWPRKFPRNHSSTNQTYTRLTIKNVDFARLSALISRHKSIFFTMRPDRQTENQHLVLVGEAFFKPSVTNRIVVAILHSIVLLTDKRDA